MTPDEASARARDRYAVAEANWARASMSEFRFDSAAELKLVVVTALDALVRLERARGKYEVWEYIAEPYQHRPAWVRMGLTDAEAELTAAIEALAADTPRSGTEA